MSFSDADPECLVKLRPRLAAPDAPAHSIAMFLLFIVVIVSAALVIGGRRTLWPLFHLLSMLLALPDFLFACACLVMQRATSRGSLLDFFDSILSFIVAMYPWGATVLIVCLLILLSAGFGGRWRRTAAVVVIVLVLGSDAVIHWVAGLPDDAGQWWFFVPGALSALIAGGLFITAKNTSMGDSLSSVAPAYGSELQRRN